MHVHGIEKALISALVLQMPDFSKLFVIETDASLFAIGGALT